MGSEQDRVDSSEELLDLFDYLGYQRKT